MDNFQDSKNKNQNNAGACHAPGVSDDRDMKFKGTPVTGDSYNQDRTDEEIIDEMESGEYDSSDSYERL